LCADFLTFSFGDRLKIFTEVLWNFYHKHYGTPLGVAPLYIYIAEDLKCSQQSNREFNSFQVQKQKATTFKVDMKQVPVLQIYNKLHKEYMQIC